MEIDLDLASLSFDLEIEIKRLYPSAILPRYGSAGAAALDLHAHLDGPIDIYPWDKPVLIGTGIAIHIANPGFVGLIVPRSGLGHKKGLVMGNGTAVIDSDYQGEVHVSAWNRNSTLTWHKDEAFIRINPGDRIAQMIFLPIARAAWKEVEEFSAVTDRGAGGFGSTGVSAAPLVPGMKDTI